MENNFTCSDCGVLNCYRREKHFPSTCVGEKVTEGELEKIKNQYIEDGEDKTIGIAAAEIEGLYYGKLTRVEEIIAFARRLGAKKIGIATCFGLMNESKVFAKILKAHELQSFCIICKIGSIDKTEIGVPEELKIQKDIFEAACNPILQAEILARENTQLNVIMGLCVGHDTQFMKYSKAPVTYLVVKDRVLGHNPVAALYNTDFYYKRLLTNQDI